MALKPIKKTLTILHILIRYPLLLATNALGPSPDRISRMSVQYVDFESPDDPSIPFNWPIGKRVYISVLLGLLTMVVAMASSIFTSAIPTVIMMYNIDREVATLGVSLYVLGFATGPLCWAPFSELKGRKLPLVTSAFGFTVFCFATAVSKDLQSLMILRYFTGFFGAGPLTLSGAVYADIFPPHQRGIAMVGFCLMVFTGPLTAPFIGGFTVMNHSLGWRWTAYIPGILGSGIFVLLLTTMRETYVPVLLSWKADRLRREQGDWSIHAKHEEISLDLRAIIADYVSLPLKMLALDPIVLCMSVFASFVYGLLYLFLTAYPIIFQQIHGMNPGVGGLPYIGIIVGQLFGALGVFAMQPWVLRKMERNGGIIMPEWRLPIAIPGAVAFSGGLFWLGWSGYRRNISWVVPTVSGLLTGFGLLTMFLPSIAYVVEARPKKAASAVAAHTFLRSLAGAIFPLFASYMFDALGVEWACTLLGCVAALLIPIPLLLYIYGARIRNRSGLSNES
ncbi:major facilitator superfamily domain-containing protein [Aspergillus parasiticus]|uniref:Major facilitator superfamily domain-containing protein n=2 Tax=Aspergillus parasiticus TaxID=5067 RepID=A0A5N6D6C7_ASPPA|nr:major facilitator superfamily domain-containing protein [Aspergillus parasiticus]